MMPIIKISLFTFTAIACILSSLELHASEPTPTSETVQPTFTTGLVEQKGVKAKKAMVVTSSVHASQAAADILCRGGSALDAAIAAQIMLTLTEPEASGIGGGGFLLYYDRKDNKVYAYDGRETAPKGLREDAFLDKEGKPVKFLDAISGGLSVGVPGILKMLDMAYKSHGKLPWKELFAPAIKKAEDGFPINQRLNHQLTDQANRIKVFQGTRDYFFLENGKSPKPVGMILKNPELAKTLQLIADTGIQEFYEGKIAKGIVEAVRTSKVNPGVMTLDDLKNYRAEERVPLSINYRGYEIYSTPPPSAGGVTTLQLLGILAHFDLSKMDPLSPEFIHIYSEASKLAYADRNRCLADPAFVPVLPQKMLDANYMTKRAKLIKTESSMGLAKPGLQIDCLQEMEDPSQQSTTHMVIVDSEGNAVSMSSSIEHMFGSGILVDGFLLNNQMTDFSFSPVVEGIKVPNRIEPLKRPRSAMSPILVFEKKNGNLVLAIGSPGGSRIINYVTRALVNILDFKMDVQKAISSPNYADQNTFLELEKETELAKLQPQLEKMGHVVKIIDLNSGLHGISINDDGLMGGADTRREGKAIGLDKCPNP